MAEKGLAMIFGPPKGDLKEAPDDRDYEEEYPSGFEDACEAAFDAIRSKDSREFCRAMLDALKAFEQAPHEENRDGREEVEVNGEGD